jgi:hypothetical protein
VSIIAYAKSNGCIFVLIGCIKPEIRRSMKKVNRESPRLIRKKTFLEKRNSENVKDYFERLVLQRPQIARIEVDFEINFHPYK